MKLDKELNNIGKIQKGHHQAKMSIAVKHLKGLES